MLIFWPWYTKSVPVRAHIIMASILADAALFSGLSQPNREMDRPWS